MKISAITLTPIQTHRRTGSISSHLILQMHTEEGITGLGEISDLDMYRMYMPDIEAVRMGIEKVVLGRDPFAIEAMHVEMAKYLHTYFASAPSYPPFTPGSQIAAGIDMACFDIMGKALNTPAYNLFGGKVRDGIEICYPLFQVKSEADYERNLANTIDLMYLLVHDEVHGRHNRALLEGWVKKHGDLADKAAAALQPIWSQPHSKPVSFEHVRTASHERIAQILGELGLSR